MKTASIEYDDVAVRSNNGRYYHYLLTLYRDGRAVGHRRFEKRGDAEKSARAWEDYDDADYGTSVYDAITG